MHSKALLSVVLFASLLIVGRAEAADGIRFEITGSGTLTHLESVVPGQKPFVSKLTAAQIAACITGSGDGCIGGNLELNGTGKAFLYIPSAGTGETIYVSTDPSCGTLTRLDGLVGGTGTFMYAGQHDLSDTSILIQGTVSFTSGTLTPTGLKKASILAVSSTLNHYGVGSFAAVSGTATVVHCLP